MFNKKFVKHINGTFQNYTPAERPKTMEYHVNYPSKPDVTSDSDRRWSVAKIVDAQKPNLKPTAVERRPSSDTRILETEIDNAFEDIDKT